MAFLLAAMGLPTLVSAADWPGWRGPSRNGISPETGLQWSWPAEGPKVLWKGAVGRGFSSFAVVQGRVYTLGNQDNTDTVFCLEAATGRELWRYAYPCPLDPLAHEGGPGSTPAVQNDRVYTVSKAGHLFCLETAGGRVIWSAKLEAPPTTKEDYKVWWGFHGSPLVSGDRILLAAGAAGMAWDKASGKVVWDNGPGRSGYSSPVLFSAGAEPAFAFLSGHEIVAGEVKSGRVLWKTPWRTTWDQNASDILVAENQLFVSTGHGVGCALFDLASGKPVEVWRNKNLRSELSTAVLWKGCLYGYDEKRLTCLDWRTGAVKWALADSRQGSLCLADGKLIALEENGLLRIVEATGEACKPLAAAPILGGRCWTVPVLADGRLFARNALGEVVCLNLQK